MGAISSRILSRRKILSNATTERLSPRLQRKAEKRAEKARKKGKPHLEITADGYLHLVVRRVAVLSCPSPKHQTDPSAPAPKPAATAPKGKDRGRASAKSAKNDETSSAATTSSRPRAQKQSPAQTDPTEEDSFYDEAFGLWVRTLALRASVACVAVVST